MKFGLKFSLAPSKWRPGRFKSERKTLKVKEEDFEAARTSDEVKSLIKESGEQEELLEKENLIHS